MEKKIKFSKRNLTNIKTIIKEETGVAFHNESHLLSHGKLKSSGFIAASVAIMFFAVPVCAFTINSYLHRDNIEHFVSGTDIGAQNSPDIIKNLVTENEDYRLTLDALLSDGHSAMMIITSEAISENGQKHFNKTGFGIYIPSFCVKYADGSDGPSYHSMDMEVDFPIIGTSYIYEYEEEANARDDIRSASIVDCRDIDLGKDVQLELFMNDEMNNPMGYFGSRDPILADLLFGECDFANYLEGIEFIVNLTPNVTCNTLHDADGNQIFMSSFELYSNDPTVIPGFCEVTFIKDSGERIILENKDNRVHTEVLQDHACLVFGEFIDPNDYIGVEVNGVEYRK